MIRLKQFGCPEIQDFYKKLCKTISLDYDKFIEKLISDTERTIGELKSSWICSCEEDVSESRLEETIIDDYLIIHFDLDKKETLGIINDNYPCYTDGKHLYEMDHFNIIKKINQYRNFGG